MIDTLAHRDAHRWFRRRVIGPFAYCAALTPLSLIAMAHSDPARFWGHVQHRLLGEPDHGYRVLGSRRATHTLLGIVFGVVGLLALALLSLFIARGVLYGVVDDGPYTHSWGGPTRAGAWAVHFAVALVGLIVTVAVTAGTGALHRRATDWLRGATLPAWFVPVAAVVTLAVALFVAAWTRQL